MTKVGEIIKNILEFNHDLNLDEWCDRIKIATECEDALAVASMEQLALLIGGTIHQDSNDIVTLINSKKVILTPNVKNKSSRHRNKKIA